MKSLVKFVKENLQQNSLPNESFKDKKNINEPYYGMDILEYKFTHVSQGRINKTRIENFMLDNHEQNKARLLQILDKIG